MAASSFLTKWAQQLLHCIASQPPHVCVRHQALNHMLATLLQPVRLTHEQACTIASHIAVIAQYNQAISPLQSTSGPLQSARASSNSTTACCMQLPGSLLLVVPVEQDGQVSLHIAAAEAATMRDSVNYWKQPGAGWQEELIAYHAWARHSNFSTNKY